MVTLDSVKILFSDSCMTYIEDSLLKRMRTTIDNEGIVEEKFTFRRRSLLPIGVMRFIWNRLDKTVELEFNSDVLRNRYGEMISYATFIDAIEAINDSES
jgi:hypothetical protein